MPVAANVRFIFVALVLGTGLAQRTGPKAADSAGRATPEQREHAGIGAAVPTLPGAETLSPSQQAQRVAGWPAEIRKQLFIPAVLPSLDARTWSMFSPMPGVLADRVSYAAANGMLVPRSSMARSRRRTLEGEAARHRHRKWPWRRQVQLGCLLQRHAVCEVRCHSRHLRPDWRRGAQFGEGLARRCSRYMGEFASGLPRTDWGQRLAALMQVDVMQAVSYLNSRPEVDPRRIAVAGYSMGGFIVGITGAIAPPASMLCSSAEAAFTIAPAGTSTAIPARCRRTRHCCRWKIAVPSSMRSTLSAARCSS